MNISVNLKVLISNFNPRWLFATLIFFLIKGDIVTTATVFSVRSTFKRVWSTVKVCLEVCVSGQVTVQSGLQ